MIRDVSDRHRRRHGHLARAVALALATLAGALSVTAVAGCGGGGSSDGAGTTASAPTSTAARSTTSTTTSAGSGGGAGAKQPASGLTDAQGVRAAVEAAIASRDPEQACDTYVTDRFLRTAYGGLHSCLRAQTPGRAATSLRSLRERIHADTASATAVPVGGPYGGAKVTASLVLENGTWKVDALHAHVPVGP